MILSTWLKSWPSQPRRVQSWWKETGSVIIICQILVMETLLFSSYIILAFFELCLFFYNPPLSLTLSLVYPVISYIILAFMAMTIIPIIVLLNSFPQISYSFQPLSLLRMCDIYKVIICPERCLEIMGNVPQKLSKMNC